MRQCQIHTRATHEMRDRPLPPTKLELALCIQPCSPEGGSIFEPADEAYRRQPLEFEATERVRTFNTQKVVFESPSEPWPVKWAAIVDEQAKVLAYGRLLSLEFPLLDQLAFPVGAITYRATL